jgi:hypothetical protein
MKRIERLAQQNKKEKEKTKKPKKQYTDTINCRNSVRLVTNYNDKATASINNEFPSTHEMTLIVLTV